MVSDPIGDMLIQIKNASLIGKANVRLPYSKMKRAIAELLKGEGYISSFEKIEGKPSAWLRLTLKYQGKQPAITDVRRISKPGLRVYTDAKKIPMVVGGMGIAIVSTPKGIMSGKVARQKNLGGELLCAVW